MFAFDKLLKEKAIYLTRSQQKLMQYIIAHDEECIFLNIAETAERVNVSEASVVRLAKSLGFRGFPEFRKELRVYFRSKLSTTARLQNAVKKKTNEVDILTKVLQADIDNISETLKQASKKEFMHFIKSINSAERILIVGLRSAHSLAIFLGMGLKFLQKDVWVIQPGIGDMWDRLLGLKESDLVIGISFPRYSRQTIEVLRFAKKKNVKTLAITDSHVSPLAQFADHVLSARYKMNSFMESLTAPLSLINAIVTALGVYSKKRTMKSFKELEEIWKSQKIYYP